MTRVEHNKLAEERETELGKHFDISPTFQGTDCFTLIIVLFTVLYYIYFLLLFSIFCFSHKDAV